MDVLLPYPNMVVSAACLAEGRLSRQRTIARQLVYACLNRNEELYLDTQAWELFGQHMMAARLWGDTCIAEWRRRGGACEMHYQLRRSDDEEPYKSNRNIEMPGWLGVPEVHREHRQILLEEDPVWYSQFGWS